MTSEFYGIRPLAHNDIDYVTSCWLRGQWDEPHINHMMHKDLFFQQHHRIIEALLKAKNVTWLVAHDLQNPNYILGFLCGEMTEEAPILHYVYTRIRFRTGYSGTDIPKLPEGVKLNIATTLWQTWLGDRPLAEGGQYTHMAQEWRPFLRHLGLAGRRDGWIYCPYALYYRLPGGWQDGMLTREPPEIYITDPDGGRER